MTYYKEYFKKLEREGKIFEKAEEIAKIVKKRASTIFQDCKVFLCGSYVKGSYTLSSDLDILIVAENIPKRLRFEYYYATVKKLLKDLNFSKINIHLLNKEKFLKRKKIYEPLLEIN